MKLAIMQPYFFPYIGYYQLISLVDKFIIYDDVAFIKNGWINRNRILLNKSEHFITLSLSGASSHKLINETYIQTNASIQKKILKTIHQEYSKAPYFNETYKLVEEVIDLINIEKNISTIALKSLKIVTDHLKFETEFELSSEKYSHTKGIGREERLFKIIEENKADEYINLPGGNTLYSKEEFLKRGINLSFLEPGKVEYKQFSSPYIPNLSIIDVLMFNGKDDTLKLISRCTKL
ncbi:MAG: WbqC family protein [Candidatus Marinimicrobia bacterium]|nr:WbqC family protein [Candidatus Neomarinimicrobiota bacterium]